MLIIPAIDLVDGACVRLTEGDFSRSTRYSDHPVAVARSFVEQGAEWIHVVDLDGAKAGKPSATNREVVRRIAVETSAQIELGGGIASDEDLVAALDAGIARVVLGSALVRDPAFAERAASAYGERVVAGIDARDGLVAVSGWLETSLVSAVEMARRVSEMGFPRIVVTDIATDGALTGPNTKLLAEVAAATPARIVASGGVSSLADIVKLAELGLANLEGVIVGKAIYEGRLDLGAAIKIARTR